MNTTPKAARISAIFKSINEQFKTLESFSVFVSKAFDVTFTDYDKETINAHRKIIEDLEIEISDQVTVLLGLFKVVGIDLRFAVSSIKISLYQSLIAKWMLKTIKRIQVCNKFIDQNLKIEMMEMINCSIKISKNSADLLKSCTEKDGFDDVSFVKRLDSDSTDREERVNAIYRRIKREIKNKIRNGEAKYIVHLGTIVEIAKNLERISDYATEIEKASIYVATGDKYEFKID